MNAAQSAAFKSSTNEALTSSKADKTDLDSISSIAKAALAAADAAGETSTKNAAQTLSKAESSALSVVVRAANGNTQGVTSAMSRVGPREVLSKETRR